MTLPTMYARKEPTTEHLKPLFTKGKMRFDVVIYRDADAQQFYARFVWWHEKPRKSQKTITLNGVVYPLQWLAVRKRGE